MIGMLTPEQSQISKIRKNLQYSINLTEDRKEEMRAELAELLKKRKENPPIVENTKHTRAPVPSETIRQRQDYEHRRELRNIERSIYGYDF